MNDAAQSAEEEQRLITQIRWTSHLGLADGDYVAGRLLLHSGLVLQGLGKIAEAIEKQFKLALMLHEKITTGRDMTVKELKAYEHRVVKLANAVNARSPGGDFLHASWLPALKLLEESYKRRYPEHWKDWEFEVALPDLDQLYALLRSTNVLNFPEEDKARAAEFGCFLGDIWRNQDMATRIRDAGVMSPIDALKFRNEHFDALAIDEARSRG